MSVIWKQITRIHMCRNVVRVQMPTNKQTNKQTNINAKAGYAPCRVSPCADVTANVVSED